MPPKRKETLDRVRYHTKLRAANVAKKKISLDFFIEKFNILKRKQRTTLRENKDLAKELAATREELAAYKREAVRQLEIASIYIPRAKAWIDESSRSMEEAMLKHIKAVGLMEAIARPNGRLSLVPQDSTLLDDEGDVETRPRPRPPGPRLRDLGVPVIPEEDEPEDHDDGDVPERLLRRALENGAVTRRVTRFRSDEWSPPIFTLPRPDCREPEAAFGTWDVDVEQPTESTPARPREHRPATDEDPPAELRRRTRSARKTRSSLASGTAGLRDGCAAGREELHRLSECWEPPRKSFRASPFAGTTRRSPRCDASPADRPGREDGRRRACVGKRRTRPAGEDNGPASFRTPAPAERSGDETASRNTPGDDGQSLDASGRARRASRAVSYKEPSLNKKLRRP